MSTPNAIVVDANLLVAICSKEQDTYPIADSAFDQYAQNGWEFFAPNIVVAEVLFAVCVKLQNGDMDQSEFDRAIELFQRLMQVITTPDNEAGLIPRAVEIRGGYNCKRTSDSLYIALAEELSHTRFSEIVTFDNGFKNQIANSASTVSLNLLSV